MHYKTIALELLRQYPETYQKLRRSKSVLPALDRYASDLKASHEEWTAQLLGSNPGSNPVQIGSEALEIAIHELKERFRSDSPPSEADGFPLDDAMNFLRRHTPTA